MSDVRQEAERRLATTVSVHGSQMCVIAPDTLHALLDQLAAHEQEIVRLRWCLMEAESARDAALAEVARLTADVDRLSTRLFTARDNTEVARLKALIARLRPWDVSEADWAAAVAAGLSDSPLTTP